MRNSRHTYATLLHELGAKPAAQKEQLRHADIQTTMNLYTQAVTPVNQPQNRCNRTDQHEEDRQMTMQSKNKEEEGLHAQTG